ncbi:MAG: twin-arginine translocase TatA/TatE family subunit [Myxococcales bacterium]|nr:MAG: twin-arginine translocase TatA/TatE family subunit [Myxococcales bacterium]
MFGVSSGELIVIAIILLIAVGPDRMPTLMKAGGRAIREFRKAATELRKTTGIDELLRDDDFRAPMRPLARRLPTTVKDKPVQEQPTPKPSALRSLNAEELEQEEPIQGVDVAYLEAATETPEQREPKA